MCLIIIAGVFASATVSAGAYAYDETAYRVKAADEAGEEEAPSVTGGVFTWENFKNDPIGTIKNFIAFLKAVDRPEAIRALFTYIINRLNNLISFEPAAPVSQ